MTLFFVILVVILVCFAGVLLKGAPYLPTLKAQGNIALDLLDLQPGQKLLELGSGDGTVLKLAAERGIRSVGIELNPILVIVSRIRLRKYGSLVEVRWGNFWAKPWPTADGVFVFLLDKYMLRLDAQMSQYGTRLVSIAFAVPDKKPAKRKRGVFLYDNTDTKTATEYHR